MSEEINNTLSILPEVDASITSNHCDNKQHERFIEPVLENKKKLYTDSENLPLASRRRNKNLKNKIINGKLDLDELDVKIEKFPYLLKELPLDDLKKITKSLGYIPFNLLAPGFYDKNLDSFVSLCLYPLNSNDNHLGYTTLTDLTPFPTMYWLACPIVHDRISKLEEEGWVQKLQDRLHEKEEYLEQMKKAHQSYAEQRWNYLSEEHKEYVIKQGW